MKKIFRLIIVLLLSLLLSACGTEPKNTEAATVVTTEATVERTEPEIIPEPEWFSEAVIDEAVSYLFPLEGEKNVPLAQELLLPLVESGNPEAQYYWGYIYDWEIVDNNGDEEKESLYWFELAAEQGFPKAYLAAALNEYIDSDERARLVEAAKQEDIFELTPEELGADGCAYVGAYYFDEEEYGKAMDWWLKGSDMGSSGAMYNIGYMYCEGIGVEQDYTTSLDCFLKAANLGDVYAMNFYGYVLCQEEVAYELINQEYASALAGYLKAADEGDPVAMCNIGYMYDMGYGGFGKNRTNALKWYQNAADAGDAYSMYKLGIMYQYGTGVAKDYEMAMEWYQKAAELGNANAMYMIGSMYKWGLGVEKDQATARKWDAKAGENWKAYEESIDGRYIDFSSDESEMLNIAMEWFQKAADIGYADAIYNIGYYGYGEGQGVNVNNKAAIKWYEKAADAGSSSAMCNLGWLYAQGSGVSPNYNVAMEWFIKAYANGAPDNAADWIDYLLEKQEGINEYFEHYGELIFASS